MIVSRFAPSPTGRLHLGHAWSAVLAHERARSDGGRFLLRIEDIDGTRSRPEHVRAIFDDMEWLGLAWDGPVVFQSERVPLYTEALERLHTSGLTYRCFCTRADIAAEIAAAGSAPHDDDAPPPHPAACRHRPHSEIDARLGAGEPFVWRLDMAAANAFHPGLGWHDEIAGPQIATPETGGDIVLWRKDAPASYHLAVTVDDAAQGIGHVVRGRDLFGATHVQRLLQELLGLPTPTYRHHALLTDASGNRLAKRHGAPTLADLRADFPDGRALADLLRAGNLPNGYASA
ncbi:tRNA glutamyl-Q(34) synthetase GluQRS [Sphingomonas bacterium]|uniref:tRNA glutamyl-Q(34) synthetase GluQRS n=1 Tax=Sphingomonas bacterium TaxID=1895847 RepID=UPI0026073725|nr:tRNA glutamyl-Q(34) synthetase GluQRS [Sphingomonas bacterium]MDB5677419.1 tRNA glutamyl-Q(34) synthetase GluQRS [Sphingomonas bacterium]